MAVEVRPVGGGRTEAKGDLRDTGEMQARCRQGLQGGCRAKVDGVHGVLQRNSYQKAAKGCKRLQGVVWACEGL